MGRNVIFVVFAALCAVAITACDHVAELDDSNGSDTDTSTDTSDTGNDPLPPPMDAMDVIFVVDDSTSMSQEQSILATSVFHLIASLTTPPPDWPYPAVDDVRVAVVTTNMGFSAGGESGDEYWPGDMVPDCQGFGDDGRFQGIGVEDVTIADGVIPCWDAPGQCPPGWECTEGFCTGAVGNVVECPTLDADWAEYSGDPDGSLALEVACLANQGTNGCGFEQQLASAARAGQREDQAPFFRENAGLGIIVVSDEDDCSMDDAAGLFATDEVADQALMKVNIACGEHPEFLHAPESFVEAFAAAKGGIEAAVFFAAIVGVPPTPACQGNGALLGDCLDQDEMQLVPTSVGTTWLYDPACTRFIGSEEVTKAYPGRRFVALAEEMGRNGYAYSICNENWMPAMEAFASILAGAVAEF